MTLNSSNKFPRNRSSRPASPSDRASRPAPFGSLSTRPPTSPVPASAVAKSQGIQKNLAKGVVAIDEELWFGAAHDHAVAEDAAARSMAALVGRIIGAKPFPMSARRLADLTRQDVVRIEPVIQVLESDPGLSARLLRLVNSAGYALRQRCTSVRHAATLVGTDRLHQIATTAAVMNLFDSKGPVAAQIIEHSTVVGAFCRYLGAHLALPVDDLFTAGFLHDIGKLMLMETENEQYVELLAKCSSKPDTIHHLERALYGFDHAVLAAHVLSAWNIPDPVPKIVAWHHEPTHAYKVSSMMAALVQTVRLADAIVYVMQEEPEGRNIKELAQHESASYLDISEPQLAAMWDELEVLYHESREQCLGENAPALDPRSLRPKNPIAASLAPTPSERAHELPKQFPCVECGCPTYGNTCPACGGYVCPNHQVGREGWCSLCARDYRAEKNSTPVPTQAKWVFGVLSAAVIISGAAGMISSGGQAALRAGVGTLLLGSLVTLLYVIGKQWLIRSRFVRTRPNRFIPEPLLNDGGTHSLVPPEISDEERREAVQSASAILKANVRLVEPLKEIAIREISDRDYGLDESARVHLDTSPRPQFEGLPFGETPKVDSNRVQLQSNSLVTLPAPAAVSAAGQAESHEFASSASNDPHLSPIDTPHERERSAFGQYDEADEEQDAAPETAPVLNRHLGGSSLEQSLIDDVPERDTLCGPDFQRMSSEGTLLSSVTLPKTAEALAEPALAVRPMPTIDIATPCEELVARTNFESDSTRMPEPNAATDSPNLEKQELAPSAVSVHPLSALGLNSEAPADPIQQHAAALGPIDGSVVPTVPSNDIVASRIAQPEQDNLAAELPAPVAHALGHPVTEMDSVPQTGARIAASSPLSSTEGLVESIVQRSAAQFGPEFEARVTELVAQRVAELVAERMLRAFGTGLPLAAAAGIDQRRTLATATDPGGDSDPAPVRRRPRKPRRSANSPKRVGADAQLSKHK